MAISFGAFRTILSAMDGCAEAEVEVDMRVRPIIGHWKPAGTTREPAVYKENLSQNGGLSDVWKQKKFVDAGYSIRVKQPMEYTSGPSDSSDSDDSAVDEDLFLSQLEREERREKKKEITLPSPPSDPTAKTPEKLRCVWEASDSDVSSQKSEAPPTSLLSPCASTCNCCSAYAPSSKLSDISSVGDKMGGVEIPVFSSSVKKENSDGSASTLSVEVPSDVTSLITSTSNDSSCPYSSGSVLPDKKYFKRTKLPKISVSRDSSSRGSLSASMKKRLKGANEVFRRRKIKEEAAKPIKLTPPPVAKSSNIACQLGDHEPVKTISELKCWLVLMVFLFMIWIYRSSLQDPSAAN